MADDLISEVFSQVLGENDDVDEDIESLFLQSTSNFDCLADRTWSTGKLSEVCASVKDKYKKANERFQKRTSADILAEISFDESAEKNDNASEQFQQKRSRRVRLSSGASTSSDSPTQEQGDNGMGAGTVGQCETGFVDEENFLDVQFYPPYPHLGDGENKIVNAYLDDIKVVGCGRGPKSCQFPCYTNPFDPRLTFKGIQLPIRGYSEEKEDEPVGTTYNYFLTNDRQLTNDLAIIADNFLNSYREYLGELSNTPSQLLLDETDTATPKEKTAYIYDLEDDSSEECKKLFDKIRSDCVKNSWAHPERTVEFQPPEVSIQEELTRNCDQITKDTGFPITIPTIDICIPDNEQDVLYYFSTKGSRGLAELDRAMNDRQERKLFLRRRHRLSEMRPNEASPEQKSPSKTRKSEKVKNNIASSHRRSVSINKTSTTDMFDVASINHDKITAESTSPQRSILQSVSENVCAQNDFPNKNLFGQGISEGNPKQPQQIAVLKDVPNGKSVPKSVGGLVPEVPNHTNITQKDITQEKTIHLDTHRGGSAIWHDIQSGNTRHHHVSEGNVDPKDINSFADHARPVASSDNAFQQDFSVLKEKEVSQYPTTTTQHQLKATSEPFVPSTFNHIPQDQATQKPQKGRSLHVADQSSPVYSGNRTALWRPLEAPPVTSLPIQTPQTPTPNLLLHEVQHPNQAPPHPHQEVQQRQIEHYQQPPQQPQDDPKLQQHIREQQQLIQQHYQQLQQHQQQHRPAQVHPPLQPQAVVFPRYQSYSTNGGCSTQLYGATVQKRSTPLAQEVTSSLHSVPSPGPALPVAQQFNNQRISLQEMTRRPPPDMGYSASSFLPTGIHRYATPLQNMPNYTLASALTAHSLNTFGGRYGPQNQPTVILPQLFHTLNANQQSTTHRGPYFSYNFNLNYNGNSNVNNNNNNCYVDNEWEGYDNLDNFDVQDYNYSTDFEETGHRIDVLDNYRQTDFKEKLKDRAIKRASKKARAIRSSLIKVI